MALVVIGLGSNIKPEENVKAALSFFELRFHVLKKSKLLKTEPIGMADPHYFLNAGVLIETEMTQEELFSCLREQEAVMGRIRTKNKFASRPIDFDILSWNDELLDEDIAERVFLQEILKELLPEHMGATCL